MSYHVLMEHNNLLPSFAMPKKEHTIVEGPGTCDPLVQFCMYNGERRVIYMSMSVSMSKEESYYYKPEKGKLWL